MPKDDSSALQLGQMLHEALASISTGSTGSGSGKHSTTLWAVWRTTAGTADPRLLAYRVPLPDHYFPFVPGDLVRVYRPHLTPDNCPWRELFAVVLAPMSDERNYNEMEVRFFSGSRLGRSRRYVERAVWSFHGPVEVPDADERYPRDRSR